jgi:YD repeat-containing protein
VGVDELGPGVLVTQQQRGRPHTGAWAATIALLLANSAQADSVTYTYDVRGQLISATSSDGPAAAYTYDAAGNRTLLTASGGNQSPVAVNDSITTVKNTAKTFDPRTNDSDGDSDPLTISAKTNGAHGTVAINSGASLTFTPTTNYTGSDSFTYTISDGQGGTANATVSVTVAANSAPDAVNDSVSIETPLGSGAQTVNVYVLTNDTDPDGHTLTITAVTDPAGAASTTIMGTYIRVTSVPNGTTTFTYTISDGNGGTDTATGTIVRTSYSEGGCPPDCN